ncbi:MAG: MFS transporter [Alphaproteobacteria bacterium]|nr:MFS transporter [Alphaproteobacteria bacterium]MBV9694635.1 MFS transporter [Alphaproteobacteria bacterium]
MDTRTISPDATQTAALPTLLAVMFVNMVGFGIVVPLLPFYAKSFSAPAWQMALIFSAYAAGAFFGEPFWGRMSDRLGRKPILISTVCGNCLCYFALAFAPDIWSAFIVRFLGGMASGNGSVIQGYIADVTPAGNRTGRMSMLGAAYNLGFIVGPALGGLLAHPSAGHAGFRLPLVVASGLAGLCAVGITLFVRESRMPRHHLFDSQPSRWAVAGHAVTHPVIARLMLVMFLAGSAFMGIEFVFSLWSAARFGWTTREVGLAFAVTGVVAVICQLLVTGRVSRRFGEANVLALGMALTTAAISLLPFAHGAWVVALLAFSAFGQSIAGPNISALISRHAAAEHQGQYLGLNNAAGALARLTGPFMAGLAFANVGVNAPFFLAGLLVAPAILLARQARR